MKKLSRFALVVSVSVLFVVGVQSSTPVFACGGNLPGESCKSGSSPNGKTAASDLWTVFEQAIKDIGGYFGL